MSESDKHEKILTRLAQQHIETQSWGYVSTGTRFKVFNTPGTPRDVWEKIDDAALVHRLTGVAPSVALHIPWDQVDDYGRLSDYAKKEGLVIGSISPNLFQDDDYKFGSLTNLDPKIRRKAIEHSIEVVDVMRSVGSTQMSMWLADGTNYPGQADFRRRRHFLREGLQEIYAALDEDMTMVLEYKLFEPAFYHTDIADWGQSLSFCQKLGDRAKVLVDLGHHALGVNIEHIVATLLDENRLGGFDLNGKKYADDDLFVGAINPYELFLIAVELVGGEDDADPRVAETARNVLYKIDQCAMIEDKIPAMLRSVTAMQAAFAKALLVDRAALSAAQEAGDVVTANEVLTDAYETDVRPLLRRLRERQGVVADPLGAYRDSEDRKQRISERVGTPAGW
ncbi:L-rhamnose isomerase [Arthrobacter bambusae]|uniref:L-rhamnose isomerase n=1 Tax=unclassified Arthrobacter TaxID=235627 RepID=UPI00254B51B1|nr:L-rhamnose isomerase [Arthrobacter sp. efr-133-R2A-120]